MGYLLDHCCFDKLSSQIIDRCQPFSCKNDAGINSFFHNGTPDNYADYQKERMAVSHCFHTDEPSPRMVCAFSLSSTALRVDILPGSGRSRFNRRRKIPNTKRRAQYPAILIGQLCVFDGFGSHSFEEGDVGKEMMDLIKTIALNPDNNVAVRYLVVDATNKPSVLEYYQRNGFEFLFTSESDEYDYLHKKGNHHGLFQRIKNFWAKEPKVKDPLNTRLMLFDLIVLKA